MNIEIRNRLDQLPEYVQDSSRSEEASNAVLLVYQNYLNNDAEKLSKFKDIIGLTFLKDIKVEQLPLIVKEALGLDEKSAGAVSLLVLREMLYPVKDFFPGVGDEILKLGGEVPQALSTAKTQQFSSREEAIEDMLEKEDEAKKDEMKDAIVYGKIEDLISQYPEIGTTILGTQGAISIKDMPDMKPMIKYWIKDYKDKVAVYNHSNLDRVQYVCHDKNTRNMNDEERRQLNLIVKSVDGEQELPYSTKMKKIDFSLIEDE